MTTDLTPWRGVDVQTLPDLEDVLWEWVHVTERFVRLNRENKDLPWWYKERASLSVFAGAVWRVGGVALEEATATKKRAVGQRSRGPSRVQGRCDLYFRLAGRDFQAEAKQLWPPGGLDGSGIAKLIQGALRDAGREAKRNDANQGKRIAILFVSPSLGKGAADEMQAYVEGFLERMREVNCAARAWTFLNEKNRAGVPLRGSKRYYPGVAVFMDQIA